MDTFKIIAITHRDVEVEKIGMFHIGDDEIKDRLHHLKNELQLDGLMFLATCNRVEFLFTNEQELSSEFLQDFFSFFNPNWEEKDVDWASNLCNHHSGQDAIEHLFKVASSACSSIFPVSFTVSFHVKPSSFPNLSSKICVGFPSTTTKAFTVVSN